MDSDYQQQAQRLKELRQQVHLDSSSALPLNGTGNRDQPQNAVGLAASGSTSDAVTDPMIYPGLYAPSGIDMLGILIRIHQRPHPTLQLGSIDSGAALILCTYSTPDLPIVYCSDAFTSLTGYTFPEIRGHNCRFLQTPPRSSSSCHNQAQLQNDFACKQTEVARSELRASIGERKECAVKLVNYRKDGSRFENVLSVIPIWWEEEGVRKWYAVGFQADAMTGF